MTDFLNSQEYEKKYDLWLKSDLRARILNIVEKSIHAEVQTVVYSGPSDQHGPHQFSNRHRAESYAKREGAITIEGTSRGNYLEQHHKTIYADLRELVGPVAATQFIFKEWKRISQDYAQHAQGDVRAFVVGAHPNRVFRTTELPALVSNPRVLSINGVPRSELEKTVIHVTEEDRKNNIHWDRVYRKVTQAGLNLDMRQALRTGDEKLILDALAQRQIHHDQQRLEQGCKALSKATQTENLSSLTEQAARLADISQDKIRLEALENMRAYTSFQVEREAMKQSDADRLMRVAAKAVQNPQKAFRIKELAVLKLMKAETNSANAPNAHDIHTFSNAKKAYEADLRAVRQANGQPFADAESRSVMTAHSRRSMIARAELKQDHHHTARGIYAQLENRLDAELQVARTQDEFSLALRQRQKVVRTQPAVFGYH